MSRCITRCLCRYCRPCSAEGGLEGEPDRPWSVLLHDQAMPGANMQGISPTNETSRTHPSKARY